MTPVTMMTFSFGQSLREPITITVSQENDYGRYSTVQGSFTIWTYRQNEGYEIVDTHDTKEEAEKEWHTFK